MKLSLFCSTLKKKASTQRHLLKCLRTHWVLSLFSYSCLYLPQGFFSADQYEVKRRRSFVPAGGFTLRSLMRDQLLTPNWCPLICRWSNNLHTPQTSLIISNSLFCKCFFCSILLGLQDKIKNKFRWNQISRFLAKH